MSPILMRPPSQPVPPGQFSNASMRLMPKTPVREELSQIWGRSPRSVTEGMSAARLTRYKPEAAGPVARFNVAISVTDCGGAPVQTASRQRPLSQVCE
jgi:hypothetical protein